MTEDRDEDNTSSSDTDIDEQYNGTGQICDMDVDTEENVPNKVIYECNLKRVKRCSHILN